MSQCIVIVHVESALSFESFYSSLRLIKEKGKRKINDEVIIQSSQNYTCNLFFMKIVAREAEEDIIRKRTTHSLSLAERCISLSCLLRTDVYTYFNAHRRLISMVSLTSSSSHLFIYTHTHTCLIICVFFACLRSQLIITITQFAISLYMYISM